MMPEEWASIRSMARWVLPVLVGPSTAVTPWPRATGSREVTEENEIGITYPEGRTGPALAWTHIRVGEPDATPDQIAGRASPGHALVRPCLYHNATFCEADSRAF